MTGILEYPRSGTVLGFKGQVHKVTPHHPCTTLPLDINNNNNNNTNDNVYVYKGGVWRAKWSV